HACSAWNHVMHVVGMAPGSDAAYAGSVQLPLSGNVGPNVQVLQVSSPSGIEQSCAAPAACRSASVTLPARSLATTVFAVAGSRHTLFAYLSTQSGPTATESRGHFGLAPSAAATDATRDTSTRAVPSGRGNSAEASCGGWRAGSRLQRVRGERQRFPG